LLPTTEPVLGFTLTSPRLVDERSPRSNFDAEVRAAVPVPLEAAGLDVSWRRAIEVFIFGFFVGLADLSFTSTRGTFRD
jgi:energy-converting hydrogenase Eha subunit A